MIFSYYYLLPLLLSVYSTVQKLHPVLFVPGFGMSEIYYSSCIELNCNVFKWWVDKAQMVLNLSWYKSKTTPKYNFNSNDSNEMPTISFEGTTRHFTNGSITSEAMFDNFASTLEREGFKICSGTTITAECNFYIQTYLFPYAPMIYYQQLDSKQGALFVSIKKNIELMFEQHQTKVVLLGYSFGANTIVHFLNDGEQLTGINDEWKAKYIEKLVLLAPAFAAGVSAPSPATGIPLPKEWGINTHLFPSRIFTGYSRTWPSLVQMLPTYDLEKTVIQVSSNFWNQNFKVKELYAFYTLAKNNEAEQLLYPLRLYADKLDAHPGVDTHIIYSTNVDTPSNFKVGTDPIFLFYTSGSAIQTNEKGDGTVPKAAVENYYNKWLAANSAMTHRYMHNNVVHMDFYQDQTTSTQLLNILKVVVPVIE